MIGIGVGLFAALPRVGVLEMGPQSASTIVPIFFVAAAVSMGETLQRDEGARCADKRHVRVDATVRDQCFQLDARALLDGVRLSTYFWRATSPMLGTSIPLLMNFATSRGLTMERSAWSRRLRRAENFRLPVSPC